MSQNPEFTQLLSQLQAKWSEAEAFSSWEPPLDGQYAWRFEKVKETILNNNKGVGWGLYGTIEQASDADVVGKPWRPFFFTAGGLNGLKEFFTVLTGEPPQDIHQITASLEALVGSLVAVDLYAKPDRTGIMKRWPRPVRPLELPATE